MLRNDLSNKQRCNYVCSSVKVYSTYYIFIFVPATNKQKIHAQQLVNQIYMSLLLQKYSPCTKTS